MSNPFEVCQIGSDFSNGQEAMVYLILGPSKNPQQLNKKLHISKVTCNNIVVAVPDPDKS